jgi:formylglycine-generating enzyme required for sulfatase activity
MKVKFIAVALLFALPMAVVAQSAEQKPQQKKKSATVAAAAVKPIIEPTTGMELVLVKGGCFQMGDVIGVGEAQEKPVHEVCVSDFYLGKYEVTQAQWEKVMGNNPASRKECGLSCPIENISWNMIQEFIGKLNSKGGAQYRLPTEAEWEYAARSGGKNEKWAGTSDEKVVTEYAWHDKNGNSFLQQVGKKKPNGLGLYDMSGNVIEWCQDVYDEAYYGASPKDNPGGPPAGAKRVLRGGTYGRDTNEMRTTFRVGDDPTVWDGSYGFRIVRAVK